MLVISSILSNRGELNPGEQNLNSGAHHSTADRTAAVTASDPDVPEVKGDLSGTALLMPSQPFGKPALEICNDVLQSTKYTEAGKPISSNQQASSPVTQE